MSLHAPLCLRHSRSRSRTRSRPFLEFLEERATPSTVQFSSANYQVGDQDGQASILVVRSGDSSTADSVNYSTSDGSATAGVLYQPSSGTLNFLPGQTSQTFTVPIINVSSTDYNLNVHLTLSAPGGNATLGAQSMATLLIVADASPITPAGLTAPNAVIQAGNGVGTLQYAPDGTLTQLLWIENDATHTADLTYLKANAYGNFIPFPVTGVSGFNLSQFGNNMDATLLFSANGTPNVFVATPADNGSANVTQYQLIGLSWQQVNQFAIGPIAELDSYVDIVGTVGPSGQFDLAIRLTGGDTTGAIWYATNSTGSWNSQEVVAVGRQVLIYPNPFGVRALSIARDAQNNAYITYVPQFQNVTPGQQFVAEYSQLNMASNRTGSWKTQTVFAPPSQFGDGGMAGSVAISPGGTVAVASFYLQRVQTGSVLPGAELIYNVLQPDGTFSHQVLLNTAAGYVAGDGNIGTGFGTQLAFDAAGAPHVVFSDYASQHFGQSGATEFVGQLRYGTLVNGTWNFQTIFSQTDPLNQQLFYPSMALTSNGAAFAGLESDASSNTSFIITTFGSAAQFPQKALAMASDFTLSTEFLQGIVTADYANYLKRTTDAGGLDFWVKQLQGGLTDEDLEAQLLSSTEYVIDNGGFDSQGHAGSGWVKAMYRDLLGRTADPGGLSYWQGQLASGVSTFSIAIGFAASKERESARINSDYLIYLDRPVDPSGLTFWLGQFTAGVRNESLIAGFIASQEYFYNHGLGTRTTWIQALYQDILHRSPTQGEVQSWLTFLG